MRTFRIFLGATCALAALLAATTASAFSWNETVDGDLSGDRLVPTAFVAAPGGNLLAMTSGFVAGVGVDRDYFTIAIPSGYRLEAVQLLTSNVDGAVSFIGVQAGTTFTESAGAPNVANLLGWHHFASSDAGTDILDDIATGPGSIGFVPPLGAGAYTFWAQDFGFQADYSMRFDVAAVPEPGTLLLILSGLAGLAAYRRD